MRKRDIRLRDVIRKKVNSSTGMRFKDLKIVGT